MAHRPGRVHRVDDLPFAARGAAGTSRAIKAAPDLVETRDEVLAMIWAIEDAIMSGRDA